MIMTTILQYAGVALVSRCREPDLEFKANGNIATAPKKNSKAVIVHSCLRSYRKAILHNVKLQKVV